MLSLNIYEIYFVLFCFGYSSDILLCFLLLFYFSVIQSYNKNVLSCDVLVNELSDQRIVLYVVFDS